MVSTELSERPDWDSYLEVIRSEVDRMVSLPVALDQPVPNCPGWDVGDLLEHVAGVFRHKIETMRSASEPPWPIDGVDNTDVRERLAEEAATLLAELSERGPREVRHTWYPDDRSNGFWFRRMAHEATVHRVDAEQAAGVTVTEIDARVAVDGIDEFLQIMLGGPWWDDDEDLTKHPVDATAALVTHGRSWSVAFSTSEVLVADGQAGQADADLVLEGSPHDLYLWLWGRQPRSTLSLDGRTELIDEIEGRLAEAGD